MPFGNTCQQLCAHRRISWRLFSNFVCHSPLITCPVSCAVCHPHRSHLRNLSIHDVGPPIAFAASLPFSCGPFSPFRDHRSAFRPKTYGPGQRTRSLYFVEAFVQIGSFLFERCLKIRRFGRIHFHLGRTLVQRFTQNAHRLFHPSNFRFLFRPVHLQQLLLFLTPFQKVTRIRQLRVRLRHFGAVTSSQLRNALRHRNERGYRNARYPAPSAGAVRWTCSDRRHPAVPRWRPASIRIVVPNHTQSQRFCRLSFVQQAAFLIQLRVFLLNLGIAQPQRRLRTVKVTTPLRSLSSRTCNFSIVIFGVSVISPPLQTPRNSTTTFPRHASADTLLFIDSPLPSGPVERAVNVCLNGCFAETHTSPELL